jgi:pyridoxine 4-dehydrogenase
MTIANAAKSGSFKIGGDLAVHRLGFGAMRVVGKGVWGEPEARDEALRTLRRVPELGINLIDTADSYGPEISERLIREALHPYKGLVIATKGGLLRPGPDAWIPCGKPDYLRQQVFVSMRRLGVERIDLWQLHRIDEKVPKSEQFDAMREFQREGLVRHLGLSEVTVAQIERARPVIPIVSVQNRYNLTDREWEAEVDYSEREGLAFLPWFPLAAGALDESGPLARVARRHGATPYQIALAWLLAHSPAMLVIPGTSSVSHLEENIRAAEIQLTPEDLEELAAVSR